MLLLIGSILSILLTVCSDDRTIVTLDYGTFNGVRDGSTGIVAFKGIRFADAPTGDLRWKAPVSPPSNNLGTVDASQFGAMCVQTTQNSIVSGYSEDCLFANVFIPNTTSIVALPVMVWFHGGGFQGGSTHDIGTPTPMLQSPASPVIFVSFEYRLGQFGFLGGSEVQKDGVLNAGLLDQVGGVEKEAPLELTANVIQRAGLRWLQRYIGKFGGDPSRVTIWGQSAGAGSTMFHLLAEGGNSQGLFHAAMGDSPSLSFFPSYNDTYIEDVFHQFASFAGCKSDIMNCLRAAEGNTLALAGSKTIAARTSTLFVFAPVLDGSFLRTRPVEAFQSGQFAQVPVLFGSNTNEGAQWSASLPDAVANTSMPNATETTVYNFLQGQFTSLTRASFDQAVAEHYPLRDYGTFSLQGQQMYGEMRYICTAGLITEGAFDSGLKAFQYHYDNPILGSNHGAELTAFFSSSSQADQDVTDLFLAMREFWTSFVAEGQPSSSPVSWNAVAQVTSSPRIFLHPGSIALENLTDSLVARCNLWHGISAELNV